MAYVEVNNMYVYLGKILHCNKKNTHLHSCTVPALYSMDSSNLSDVFSTT